MVNLAASVLRVRGFSHPAPFRVGAWPAARQFELRSIGIKREAHAVRVAGHANCAGLLRHKCDKTQLRT